MIPTEIKRTHILEALKRISREGVPPRRISRGYCLVKAGHHFPPKYTIALAHEIATGKFLSSNEFSGGSESNGFLKTHGFDVVECNCGCSLQLGSITSPSGSSVKKIPANPSTRHSERCPDCKIRVRELLERIYGTCLQNHKFSWSTHLSSYAGTSIFPVLRKVVKVLESYRGFDFEDFVRAKTVAPCDFWVPDPGFIVEFDESQHFTIPRKLVLSAYPDDLLVRFSRGRWISLCEKHNARDNDPPYRDEQRAWYDTLRDIIPSLEGLQPTVRIYASDYAWCSLNPDNSNDLQQFSDIAFQGGAPAQRTMVRTNTHVASSPSILRVALVFPKVKKGSSHGVPPSGEESQKPNVPTLDLFAGEAVDFVLFPEGYISSSDRMRIDQLSKLASDLGTPLLVGAVDSCVDSTGCMADWQVLLRFDPDGSSSHLYTKHSTAEAVAFEKPDWEPNVMLPTFELSGVRAGATICHDHYLGLLPRFLAQRGAYVWVNPSYDNVKDIKWSSILRLRAVENRFFSLCTLHDNVKKRERTHPFAFSPDGNELLGRKVGCAVVRPLSECKDPGIYVVDLDMSTIEKPLDWYLIPRVKRRPRRSGPDAKPKLVRATLVEEQPAIYGCSGWQQIKEPGQSVETDHGCVYVGIVMKEQILDATKCFRILDRAKDMGCTPIIWNAWDELPTDSACLATLMMGRAIECCAPVLVSDRVEIHELIELSNRNKIPARRTVEASGEVIVDIRYAWGLENAFNMVTDNIPSQYMKGRALNRYRRLAKLRP